LKLTTDGHKASCGFSTTAELIVCLSMKEMINMKIFLYHFCTMNLTNPELLLLSH